jgi:integrase
MVMAVCLLKTENMFNTNFNLKSVKHSNEVPINLIARWNNKKLLYSTGEKILAKHFETEKGKKLFQRVKSSYSGFSEFNARLDYIENTTRNAYRQFLNDHKRSPEPQELKKVLDVRLRNVQDSRKQSLFEFIDCFIDEAESNQINRATGIKKSKDTKRIDLDFYDKYVDFLSIELQLSNNTVGRFIKTLKVFMNEATDRGVNTNLAFKNRRFKVLVESVYRIYLDEKVLEEMYNLDLSKLKRLERVRDLFIVGCWTGLRFSDLVNISQENVAKDKIFIKTQKTGGVVVLPLHRMVRSVMERYGDYPNSLPPGLSNVKMNKYLKEIAAMMPSLNEKVQTSITRGGRLITDTKAKWECVTVHTARRSFATNLYLDGVNSVTIMKLTGHKSERVFLSYLKASAEENANIVQKHWEKKEATSVEAIEPKEDQDALPQQSRAAND